MKALRFHSFGAPDVLRWEDAPVPRPGRGQVLVRVAAAALNPKDVLTRKGKFRLFNRSFPMRSGQDLAGVVEAVGKGVRHVRPGERVYGMIGGFRGGACAELAEVESSMVALAPRSVSLEEAASVPLAAQTALQALRDHLRVQPGESVVLNGASGGVGVYAVQVAKLLGARVVAVCSSRNAEMVTELGADEVLPYDETPLLERDRHFDAVFDIFGTAPYLEARRLLAPRGRYVTAIPRPDTLRRGLMSAVVPSLEAHLVVVRSRTRDLSTLAKWIDQGRLRCVVDRIMPVESAAEAHAYLETKRARGKVVLSISHEAGVA